jgi:thioesterase domain-containing protein
MHDDRRCIRLTTQPPGVVILLGHSMGGLLAAEAATESSNSDQRIIGVVAFDTPYLGIHPHVGEPSLRDVLRSGILNLSTESDKRNSLPFAQGWRRPREGERVG